MVSLNGVLMEGNILAGIISQVFERLGGSSNYKDEGNIAVLMHWRRH